MSDTPATPPSPDATAQDLYPSPPSSPVQYRSRDVLEELGLRAAYPGALTDFYGLPTNPVSLYKTGIPFPSEGLMRRRLIPVTSHPIVGVWHLIGSEIATALNTMQVQWTSIDPVRFANEQDHGSNISVQPLPELYVWIGVEPLSLTPAKAKDVALSIKELLASHDQHEVEVAIRESIVRSQMIPWVDDFHVTERHPFTPALGVALGSRHGEGTGGLYFRSGGNIMLLTAAHVLRDPTGDAYRKAYKHKNSSQPKVMILAPGDGARKAALAAVESKIDLIASLTDKVKRLSEDDHPDGPPPPEVQASTTQSVAGVNRLAKKYKEFLVKMKPSESTKVRTIGHIKFVDRIAHGVAPHGYTLDWGCVQIAQDKVDSVVGIGNQIYIGDISPHRYLPVMYGENGRRSPYPVNGLLPIRGMVSAGGFKIEDGEGMKVLKNGRTTQTTMGVVTGLLSVVHNDVDGQKSQSFELSVVSAVSEEPFSSKGDSGAAIVDPSGRLVGLLHRGAGDAFSAKSDVTYCTPFWWLYSQIKNQFPDAVLL